MGLLYRYTYIYFVENQLSLSLTSLSPLTTSIFKILQHLRIRANITAPVSPLDRLISGLYITNYIKLIPRLRLLAIYTRWLIIQKVHCFISYIQLMNTIKFKKLFTRFLNVFFMLLLRYYQYIYAKSI